MKRILIVVLLFALGSGSALAQGKIKVTCPSAKKLKDGIIACPDTGCGPSLDPELNKKKNIRSDNGTAKIMTIAELQALADPVPDFEIGNTREKPEALGEGDKITVVAYALIARR